jgi:hypothetical protein
MIPPDYYDVFRCPCCNVVFRDVAARGGNTFGAIRWSDGWCDAPMLSQPPPIVLCPACAAPIWQLQLRAIGRGMYHSSMHLERVDDVGTSVVPDDWHVAAHVGRPTLDDLLRAADVLAGGQVDAERETRLWIWWRTNDLYREENATWDSLSRRPSQYLTSVNRLKTLLDVDDRQQRLLLAELHRESEQYGDCLALLGTFRRGRMLRIAKSLRQLAEASDSRLVAL